MIELTIAGQPIPVRNFRFPGGEMQVRIDDADAESAQGQTATITARIRSADDLMALLLLTDAVRRHYGDPPIRLVCPYLPYARQDRVAYPGEALAAAIACRLLNAQGYADIEVWDAHSDVTKALLDRIRHRPASDFAAGLIGANDIVVAPDAGAAKRAGACAKLAGAPLVLAEKRRSPDTGAILETRIHLDTLEQPVGDRNFLIIDDICDGGRTFIELAKALRPLTTGQIKLYVTHGIFSSGFDELAATIDRIYVANPFPDALPDFVQVVQTGTQII